MLNDEGKNVKRRDIHACRGNRLLRGSEAGDVIYAVEQDKLSRQIAEERKDKAKAEK